jgi:CRP-like cAMP-binding protein
MAISTNLASLFEREFPQNTEGLDEFLAAFETKTFKKNTVILEAGQIDNKLRFLDKGFVREYYASESKETNIDFYTQAQFITHFSSFKSLKASKKYQETLTTVEIKTMDKSTFLKFMQSFSCGGSIIDAVFQKLLDKKELFDYNRITKSPDELYQKILENKRNWLQKIPQYHIASYLGVTPETLSRIRARIS